MNYKGLGVAFDAAREYKAAHKVAPDRSATSDVCALVGAPSILGREPLLDPRVRGDVRGRQEKGC
jgi:hypothetical protein